MNTPNCILSHSFIHHRQLQQENEELRQLVTEHRSVLEKIMYKYRQDIQRLILMNQEETKAINIFNTSLAQVC